MRDSRIFYHLVAMAALLISCITCAYMHNVCACDTLSCMYIIIIIDNMCACICRVAICV